MNGNRNLIWGIVLSLLVHGAFIGLPISPGGQRLILPHQPMPLEISLVTLKAHEEASVQKKPVSATKPKGFGQDIKVRNKKTTTRRAPLTQIPRAGQSPKIREEKMAKGRDQPIAPPQDERGLTPNPEPLIPHPPGKIKDSAPQPTERKGPLPSAKNLVGIEGARVVPKGEVLGRLRPITLARPRYDRNPKPPYPRIARRRGYEGVVVLKVEILPDGRIGRLRVKRSSGHAILDRSALKTVRKWRFIPAKRGGEPIRMWAEIPIKFKLK